MVARVEQGTDSALGTRVCVGTASHMTSLTCAGVSPAVQRCVGLPAASCFHHVTEPPFDTTRPWSVAIRTLNAPLKYTRTPLKMDDTTFSPLRKVGQRKATEAFASRRQSRLPSEPAAFPGCLPAP